MAYVIVTIALNPFRPPKQPIKPVFLQVFASLWLWNCISNPFDLPFSRLGSSGPWR